ncbi:mechanosensitive ion channel family protein [Candidatus Woesearchaeota archaeon]|nr:mechanosensitive ion channel family protein [Candidatus Woesearchaeota archaeon]
MLTLVDYGDLFLDSFERIIVIALIIIATIIAAKVVRKLVDRSFTRASRKMHVDPTHYRFMRHFLSALTYILGLSLAVYVIPPLRTLSVSVFAGAGILAVVVGFASQEAFSNIVSGVFIVIFRPIRVGDVVQVGTYPAGKIEDITLRHTVIKSFENKRIIIPNAVLNREVIENSNIGDEKICKFVEIGISYDSDIDLAMRIMREECGRHPDLIDNRTDEEKRRGEPIVPVRVIGFGDSSISLRAWAWAETPAKGFAMLCDLRKSIKERFDREGVEIPFPYRTVVYKKDIPRPERLRTAKRRTMRGRSGVRGQGTERG